ncbi:MAG: cell division ATP-binding protein FtsE [Armatimonadota bacterium]|nr:cell division ATP-binding protein FtsE [Armatimonadota bacterium]
MIHIQGASLVYPSGVQALDSVSLSVEKGDFAFIVGATGSGKSTLLKLIYREELPTGGDVKVMGEDVVNLRPSAVPYLRRKIGIVFQDFRLLPQKTVWENLAFALRVIGAPSREIHRRIPEILDLVSLNHRSHAFPNQLSGGEQQRASIARALVNNPPLLVADEPTGNLDPDTSWDIMQLISRINIRGATILVATHDREVVNKMRKRVIVLDKGQIVRDDERSSYDVHP